MGRFGPLGFVGQGAGNRRRETFAGPTDEAMFTPNRLWDRPDEPTRICVECRCRLDRQR